MTTVCVPFFCVVIWTVTQVKLLFRIMFFNHSICPTGRGGWRSTSLPEPSGGDRVRRHQVRLQNRFCKFCDVEGMLLKAQVFLFCFVPLPRCVRLPVFWRKPVLRKQSTFQRVPFEWEWRPILKVNRNQMEIRKGMCIPFLKVFFCSKELNKGLLFSLLSSFVLI